MKIYDWYAARVGAVAEEPSRLVRIVNAWEGKLEKDKGERSQMRNPKGKLLFVGKNERFTTKKEGQDYRGKEPLFRLPENAVSYTNHLHSRIIDPANNGKGFTKEEVQDLMPVYVGRQEILNGPGDLERYCKNSDHWLMTELNPAVGPTKHKSIYIHQSIIQLSDHRAEMESYKQGVEQRIESFEGDIRSHLWVTDDFVEPASRGLDKTRADVEELLGRLAEVVQGFEALPREEEEAVLDSQSSAATAPGGTAVS